MWKNGDAYIGDWADDLGTGHGKFTWANGGQYEGDFVNNQKHGEGRLERKNGNIFTEVGRMI